MSHPLSTCFARRTRRSRLASLAAMLAAAAIAGSCGGRGGPTSPEPPASPRALYVPDSVQAIFDENCAYAGCHAGPTPTAGLDLTPDRAYASLIDVPSASCASMSRVRPGVPDQSCLVSRLTGFVAPSMPLAGWIAPEAATIVVRWIAAGAPGVDRPAGAARIASAEVPR